MKHQTSIQVRTAFTTRRNDLDNSIYVQDEAAHLADIKGDHSEAKRRRDSAADLKRKAKRKPESEVFQLPTWLVRDLGGPRDTIAYLIKERALTVIQGRTALILREHLEGQSITIGGQEVKDFVEGGQSSGMESMCDKMRIGRQAWKVAMEAPDPKTRKAVERVIAGKAGLKQARRLLGVADAKAHTLLKANLILALDAATAYLGAGT